ncbi:MAG: hypothetical protein J6X93_00720 [Bacilli bacterium]|nr:hypothetical protein [Bacilli bacterium]
MKQENYDFFYDIIDEACMLICSETNCNYLDALIRVSKDIIEDIDDSRLDASSLNKLGEIYDRLNERIVSNEDIRLAYNFLFVKALKHAKYPLDILIPDSIGLLFANIIRNYYDYNINMLEINAKCASLTNTIANFLELDTYCFAQEEDSKLATIAKYSSNMQDRDLVVYNNKLLDPLEVSVDTIFGYLESKTEDNTFIPYKAISKLMKYLDEDGIFIFLIDNDFFSYPDLNNFRNSFTGTLLGLLILPDTMFQAGKARSVLIGSKKQINDFEMIVMNMPSFADAVKLNEAMMNIEAWVRELSHIVKEN